VFGLRGMVCPRVLRRRRRRGSPRLLRRKRRR